MLAIATVCGVIGPFTSTSWFTLAVSAVSAADVPANATAMLAQARNVRSLANHPFGSSLTGIRRGSRLTSIALAAPPPCRASLAAKPTLWVDMSHCGSKHNHTCFCRNMKCGSHRSERLHTSRKERLRHGVGLSRLNRCCAPKTIPWLSHVTITQSIHDKSSIALIF